LLQVRGKWWDEHLATPQLRHIEIKGIGAFVKLPQALIQRQRSAKPDFDGLRTSSGSGLYWGHIGQQHLGTPGFVGKPDECASSISQ
jgi:hypothetical protein